MEEVDTISIAVSKIDIDKVDPLDSRRVATFINHFLCTSVTFLNQFALKCEQKLDDLQHKMFRIESALKILECKLASLPQTETNSSGPVSTPNSGVPLESEVIDGARPQTPSLLRNPLVDAFVPEIGRSGSAESISSNQQDGQSSSVSISGSEDGRKSEASSGNMEDGGTEGKKSAKDDPLYAKYFRMAAVGVPIPAIKQKMMTEGMDPSVMDL